MNLLTSFIDATQVYGPNAGRSRELRSFVGGIEADDERSKFNQIALTNKLTLPKGQLKISEGISVRPTLPQGPDASCRGTDSRVRCFAAGDGRVNENNALVAIHTLFMREHNRIAAELSRVNPAWSDERLFQESRKILIGEMQHITYTEWLPTIIGFNTAGLFDLIPLSGKQYYSGYNPTVINLN